MPPKPSVASSTIYLGLILLGILFMSVAGFSFVSSLPTGNAITATVTSSVTSTIASTTNGQTLSSTTSIAYLAQSTAASSSSSTASSCTICQVVTFHVQDSTTSAPIRGAQVGVQIGASPNGNTPPPPGTSSVLTGVTDSSGNVAFTLQAGATYSIVVTAVGWNQLTQNVNAVATVNLSMIQVTLVTTTSVAGYRAITTDKSSYNLGDTVNFKVIGFTPNDPKIQVSLIDPNTGTVYTNSNVPISPLGLYIPIFDGSFTGSFVLSSASLTIYGDGCCLHGLTLVVYSFGEYGAIYGQGNLGQFLAWAAMQPKTSFIVNWVPCPPTIYNVACPPPQSGLGFGSVTYGSFSFTMILGVIGLILFAGGAVGLLTPRRMRSRR